MDGKPLPAGSGGAMGWDVDEVLGRISAFFARGAVFEKCSKAGSTGRVRYDLLDANDSVSASLW
jgi:hypothetical protein